MNQIDYLYRFIDNYIRERDLKYSRTALEISEERLSGLIRKGIEFDPIFHENLQEQHRACFGSPSSNTASP